MGCHLFTLQAFVDVSLLSSVLLSRRCQAVLGSLIHDLTEVHVQSLEYTARSYMIPDEPACIVMLQCWVNHT